VAPGALPEGDLAGAEVALPDDAARYLRDVLRLGPGDPVELFDGSGRVVRGAIAQADADAVRVLVRDDLMSQAGESPLELTLYQAIPKGDRWEWLLEKATEVGVTRVVPLETRRTIVKIKASKVDAKLARWSKIAAGAARQCERSVVPEVTAPATLAAALGGLTDDVVALVGATEDLGAGAPAPALAAALDPAATRVALFVGPEGGWERGELDAMAAAGVRAFRCGPRVLRSETAGVVCATLVQQLVGDL
jgi:16S rRNA (uracil1498-N3)-methyltransferase